MTEQDLNKKKAQGGNAVIMVLVVLAIVAVGALAYLSGQMGGDKADDAAPAAVENATAEAQDENAAAAEAATELADAQDAAAETPETATTTDTAEPAATAETDAATPATDSAAASNEAAAAAPAAIDPGNPVVAKVGDADVTRVDVLNFIAQLPPHINQMPIEQLFPMAQEQVINTKIVEKNIDKDSVAGSEEVQKKIADAKEQILRAAYLEKEVGKRLTDKRLKSAYDAFLKKQPDVEEVKAAHILVATEAEAKDIIAKLNEGGSFAELAKAHSKDNTAQNGGDLGYFTKQDVVPEFAEVAFAMKKDAYSKEPVKTQFGYHVIKMEDKRARPKPTFEEAESFIKSEEQREILDEMLKEWREKTNIEKFDINGKPQAAKAGE